MWKLQGRERTRGKVRLRDDYTCQSCGRKWEEGTRQFDVHHLNGLCGKKSRSYDRISDMVNLITLCHRCHYHRHDFNGKRSPKEIQRLLNIRIKSGKRLSEILEMRKLGLTYREIGAKMGISRAAAHMHVMNNSKKLSTPLILDTINVV